MLNKRQKGKVTFHKACVCLVFVILLFILTPLFLLEANIIPLSSAATISENFSTDRAISTGLIVSIDANDQNKIVLSTAKNSDYLLGVAVEGNNSAVNFTKSDAKVAVASDGEVEVVVSDMNGVINRGDFVSVSWIEGVGMKATDSQKQKVLGVALESYAPSDATSYGTIDTPDGKKDVSVDSIKLRILSRESTASVSVDQNKGLEALLSKIAGKDVSLARVLTGSIVFIVSLGISGIFIFSAIRNSFISIGRNPLSSRSIVKSLVHVSLLSVIVIVIGAALSYVVLVF